MNRRSPAPPKSRRLADSEASPLVLSHGGWTLFKELTAESAICLLLGLAIWFSKTEPPCASLRLCATVLLFGFAALSQPRGRSFYSKPFFESSSFSSELLGFASAFGPPPVLRGLSSEGERLLLQRRVPCQPCRFRLYFFCRPPRRILPWRHQCGCLPLGRGAASTTTALGVNRLRQPPYSVCQSSSLGFGLSPGAPSRGAASTTAALGVNHLRRPPYSCCQLLLGNWALALFPSEGRGFYHRRVGCQPRRSTALFRLSALTRPGARAAGSDQGRL